MLVLTRKIDESIMVGDDIKVKILGINGNQIRLGIEAPRDIAVHRQEVYERIVNEKLVNENELTPSIVHPSDRESEQ